MFSFVRVFRLAGVSGKEKCRLLVRVFVFTIRFLFFEGLHVAVGLAFKLWLGLDQFLKLDLCCLKLSLVSRHLQRVDVSYQAILNSVTFFSVPPNSEQKLDTSATVSTGAANDQTNSEWVSLSSIVKTSRAMDITYKVDRISCLALPAKFSQIITLYCLSDNNNIFLFCKLCVELIDRVDKHCTRLALLFY
jgi:hypothetical protein